MGTLANTASPKTSAANPNSKTAPS